jgi:hypothetical protein
MRVPDRRLPRAHPVGHIPKVLLRRVIPAFGLLLAEHNVGRPLQRQLRVRVVVHAGMVFFDANGCFGETLDAAFRLLDAPASRARCKPRRLRSSSSSPPGSTVSFIQGARQGLPSCQRAGRRQRAQGRVSLLPG